MLLAVFSFYCKNSRKQLLVRSWFLSFPSQWQPTPVFLPGESHGQRSFVGYSSPVTRLSNFTFTSLPNRPKCLQGVRRKLGKAWFEPCYPTWQIQCPKYGSFRDSSVDKESTCNARETSLIPGLGRFPWRRDRLPTPVFLGFPCGLAGNESTCNVGDLGSISGLGRSPGKGKGYPLQYSGLEKSMDLGSQRVGHD